MPQPKETKSLDMLLVLTKASRAICGCTVFLIVFTLVRFKTVPVGVLVFTCIAKQRGGWRERGHMTLVSGFQQHPPGKEVSKAMSLLGKYEVKSMLRTTFCDEWNKTLVLIHEAEETERAEQVFFLYSTFAAIKLENPFLSASSTSSLPSPLGPLWPGWEPSCKSRPAPPGLVWFWQGEDSHCSQVRAWGLVLFRQHLRNTAETWFN